MATHARQTRRAIMITLAVIVATATTAAAVTVTLQPSSQDAFIMQNKPNRIAGAGPNNTRIRVQGSPPGTQVWRGLVQFSLAPVPAGAIINSATVELFQGSVANAPPPLVHGLHRISVSWLQSAVKWNNQPPSAVTPSATTSVIGGQGPRTFNVTTDVQSFVNACAVDHGWMIKSQTETGAGVNNDDVNYVSKEENHPADLAKRPKLTVDYTPPPCATNADCADASACTINERCVAGACVVDVLNCNDSDPCTDDICDCTVGCINSPICNDGFSCTTDHCNPSTLECTYTFDNSVCNGDCSTGTCVADPDSTTIDPVTGCNITSTQPNGTPCTADANQCTKDECLAGQCDHSAKPDGTACDDGSQCTSGEQCTAAQCGGGSPATCTPLDDCHDAGVCNPMTGMCSNPAKTPGTPCDDGSQCTSGDQCNGSAVCTGTPVVCTPLDQCHDAGTCDPQNGQCSNPPKAATTPCDDSNACTTGDQCNGGGSCVGNGTVCTPLDQCHDAGVCDPQNGQCTNPAKSSGASCNDSNACTQTDQCDGAGACVGANLVMCTASDQCHDVGTCDTGTGMCSNPPKSNGASCNDGNACTQTDQCDGSGSCVGANPVVCTALDQCHVAGTCDTGTGSCSDPPVGDGTPCSDGNGCTLDDTCTNGSCVSGTSITCGNSMVESGCDEECDVGPGGGGDCDATCHYICGPTPQAGCRAPVQSGKARILLKDKTPDKADKLTWKWVKGAATAKSDFGSPLTTTSYVVCIYDQSTSSQPILRANIPADGTCAGKPCWKENAKGFKYKDKDLTPDGIQFQLLKSGAAGQAKIVLKGKGVNLPMPTLPLTPKVTVQVKNATTCWEAQYSTAIKNGAELYKAKAD